MPASIHSLGENIFDNCKALHTILYWNDTPPTNWVATTHTYVPNKNTYSTPSYNINSAQLFL